MNLLAKEAVCHRVAFYERNLAANDAFPHDVYRRRKEVVLHIDSYGRAGQEIIFYSNELM